MQMAYFMMMRLVVHTVVKLVTVQMCSFAMTWILKSAERIM